MTGSTRGAGAKRGLLRLSIAAVACCGLSTACARTSDGSVVLARPLTFPRFFSRQAPAPHYTAAPAQHLALEAVSEGAFRTHRSVSSLVVP
jgi:hypothetical protein